MTEEDLEEAGGRGDREDWFEERGCPEMRQVERQSASNYRRNVVNPAISAKGTTLEKTESLHNVKYFSCSLFLHFEL